METLAHPHSVHNKEQSKEKALSSASLRAVAVMGLVIAGSVIGVLGQVDAASASGCRSRCYPSYASPTYYPRSRYAYPTYYGS